MTLDYIKLSHMVTLVEDVVPGRKPSPEHIGDKMGHVYIEQNVACL